MFYMINFFLLACPENDVNLQERVGNKVTKGVKSWTDCSRLCKASSTCTAWVWVKDIEEAGSFAMNCAIMDSYGKKVKDTNVISGARDCPG